MNLRPHHALCIQKFTGHGYDERFTAHLTELVERLWDWPDTGIALVKGCDDVCAHCPNRMGERCVSQGRVKHMDALTLELLGLSEADRLSWRELSERAGALLESEDFERVCGGCQWYELCKNTKIR